MSGSLRDEPVEYVDDEWDYDDGDEVESFGIRYQRRRPLWVLWLVVVVVVGLLAGVLAIVWVRHQIDPSGPPGAAVQVTIPKGSSTAAIATILAHDKVIHSTSVFRYYFKIRGGGPLLPGTYTLRQHEKYDDIISALEKPPVISSTRLTIPEGFTLNQIAVRVGRLPGRSTAKFLAVAASGQVRSRYEPAGSNNLEGLLFPATYDITADEDETAILSQMVRQFDDTVANLNIDQAAAQLGMTPYQMTIVASIVEREAKLDEDRGPIASVIYNRLHRGMALQVDSTLMFGEQLTDPHQINTKADTPYNTYKFKGLPPTPIASPGAPSLEAAISPPTTTYLYWVLIDATGKQGFASTSAEFAKLLAEAKAKGLL